MIVFFFFFENSKWVTVNQDDMEDETNSDLKYLNHLKFISVHMSIPIFIKTEESRGTILTREQPVEQPTSHLHMWGKKIIDEKAVNFLFYCVTRKK